MLNNIVETILENLGRETDFAFRKQIEFSVVTYRAILLKRDLERNVVDTQLFQTICLPLEYGANDVCCSVVTGCKGLKTTSTVPKALRTKTPTPFSYVGTPKYTTISYKPREVWKDLEHLQFTGDRMKYDVVNNYLYIKNALNLKYVLIKAIWEDPRELPKCHSGDLGIDCYADGDFPISADLAQEIITGLISQKLQILNPEDNETKIGK